MKRLLLLALLVSLSASAAVAQQADLVGAWDVERLTEHTAQPTPEGSISALLPDNPYTLAPIRLRLSESGEATITMLAARQDGYEVVDVPSGYRFEDGRLVISLGDFDTEWGAERHGDALVLTSGDGTVITLRRARDA